MPITWLLLCNLVSNRSHTCTSPQIRIWGTPNKCCSVFINTTNIEAAIIFLLVATCIIRSQLALLSSCMVCGSHIFPTFIFLEKAKPLLTYLASLKLFEILSLLSVLSLDIFDIYISDCVTISIPSVSTI